MQGTTTLNRAAESTDKRATGPDTAVQHAERQILDGLDRILRTPGARGWVLLALHLSRITAPGPREHHRRVVAAVLDDAGGKAEGRLFALGNGDMALLFRPADRGDGLTSLITKLFQADVVDPGGLCTLWPLPGAALPALDYIRARARDRSQPQTVAEPKASLAAIGEMDTLIQTAPLPALIYRQTAVLLRPGCGDRLTTLFRKVGITMPKHRGADPYLNGHVAVGAGKRLLAALLQDMPSSGLLTGGMGRAALHVDLTVTGILSDGFAAFAQACQGPDAPATRVAVEVPFTELFADPRSFALAQERLRLAGLALVWTT